MDRINSTRPVGKALPKHAAIMFRIAEKIKHVRLVGVVSSSITVSHKFLQSGLFLRGKLSFSFLSATHFIIRSIRKKNRMPWETIPLKDCPTSQTFSFRWRSI